MRSRFERRAGAKAIRRLLWRTLRPRSESLAGRRGIRFGRLSKELGSGTKNIRRGKTTEHPVKGGAMNFTRIRLALLLASLLMTPAFSQQSIGDFDGQV